MFLVQGGFEDLAPIDSIRGIGYFKLLDRNIIKFLNLLKCVQKTRDNSYLN